MTKICTLVVFLCAFSTSAFANSLYPNSKDIVKIELWTLGVESAAEFSESQSSASEELPEELSIALEKLEL